VDTVFENDMKLNTQKHAQKITSFISGLQQHTVHQRNDHPRHIVHS
jgi:truncated hemoglobin YjbI